MLRARLVMYQPSLCISGLALGFDLDLAYVSLEMDIPLLGAIPFIGQESRWPADSQKFYRDIVERCSQTVIVSPGEYSGYKMQVRNEWMVDNCDLLIAAWDGSVGGTGNCVRYAEKVGRTMDRINPGDFNAV